MEVRDDRGPGAGRFQKFHQQIVKMKFLLNFEITDKLLEFFFHFSPRILQKIIENFQYLSKFSQLQLNLNKILSAFYKFLAKKIEKLPES